ncbi:hypothetical protein [Nocardia wallacei]|uniref:hypothetical protein n=1 Tax=Nocardia wallacei TaxID=480035 RepID=UPI002456C3C5|nr:hypothetical protein [Nocardia wallacei]
MYLTERPRLNDEPLLENHRHAVSAPAGDAGPPRRTQGVVVARIVEVRPHPLGTRDRLAVIDLGNETKQQVVFGGKRELSSGQLVPAAPPGARLPGRKKMRRRRYREEWSFGMLCSSDELGWTAGGPDEVVVLDPNFTTPPLRAGQSLDFVTDLPILRDERRNEAVAAMADYVEFGPLSR